LFGFSFDGDTKLTAQQESMLVQWAEVFTRVSVPLDSLDAEHREIFPQAAAAMLRLWKDRPMPPAVAAFVERYGISP
jgi:hypothetical protein